MTDQIAYQEYIQRRYNAFCKTVIRLFIIEGVGVVCGVGRVVAG